MITRDETISLGLFQAATDLEKHAQALYELEAHATSHSADAHAALYEDALGQVKTAIAAMKRASELLDPDVTDVAQYEEQEYPQRYQDDAGVRLVYDTLTDRGSDADVTRKKIDAFESDLWMDYFGPLIDKIEAQLFPQQD